MAESTLETRLRQIEDRLQIQDLVIRYSLAADNRDTESLRALFTADAVFRTEDGAMNMAGADQIVEQLSRQMRSSGPSNHVNHAHLIELSDVSPESATGTLCAHVELSSAGQVLIAALRYYDVYRRERTGWRISSRTASYLYFTPAESYATALATELRLLVRDPPAPANYPESLATCRRFFRQI